MNNLFDEDRLIDLLNKMPKQSPKRIIVTSESLKEKLLANGFKIDKDGYLFYNEQ